VTPDLLRGLEDCVENAVTGMDAEFAPDMAERVVAVFVEHGWTPPLPGTPLGDIADT
jgi:hypothetical protein